MLSISSRCWIPTARQGESVWIQISANREFFIISLRECTTYPIYIVVSRSDIQQEEFFYVADEIFQYIHFPENISQIPIILFTAEFVVHSNASEIVHFFSFPHILENLGTMALHTLAAYNESTVAIWGEKLSVKWAVDSSAVRCLIDYVNQTIEKMESTRAHTHARTLAKHIEPLASIRGGPLDSLRNSARIRAATRAHSREPPRVGVKQTREARRGREW